MPFADLRRRSVSSRLAGHEVVNDAERLCNDPTFRLIDSEKIRDRGAALTSRLQTFETGVLAEEEKFADLAQLNRTLIGRAEAMDSAYTQISNLNSPYEPSDVRRHLDLCGFGRGEDRVEVYTQWVRNRISIFSSLSMLL